ncbi:MAG: acyl carrier protein [Clostridia bacterium]|nr:acyl carrier protein [Clostridia bacterium]
MEQTEKIIKNVIQEILEQKPYKVTEIKDEQRLIEDLGFSSLDIAQLIAHLEIELDADPFSQGALISSVRTVKSLIEVYQACLDGKIVRS